MIQEVIISTIDHNGLIKKISIMSNNYISRYIY